MENLGQINVEFLHFMTLTPLLEIILETKKMVGFFSILKFYGVQKYGDLNENPQISYPINMSFKVVGSFFNLA